MKMNNLVLLLFVLSLILSCSNESKIELPITEKKGYGPFASGMGGISPYSAEDHIQRKNTYLKVIGIPENWTDTKQGDITTDGHQLTYQQYTSGLITKETFESLNKSSNWASDTMNLSKEPLKCKIAYTFGIDSTGVTKMVVDANNNLDFSDDTIFTPTEFNPKWNKDSLVLFNSISVAYERYVGNEIVKMNAPLFIVHDIQYNRFMCNFPQYAIAQLDGVEIAICSDKFAKLSYYSADIVVMNDSLSQGVKPRYENIISKNEYINIKGKIYKNRGVNLNKNVLTLEKADLPKNQLLSTQVGFKSFPFEGKDFVTDSFISLDHLKGKYVLLDFWAVWCGPCKDEMPNLKSLYERMDKSKFEIIGIVEDSPSDQLKEIIDEYTINWPQIQSDVTNNINNRYGINRFPTTFLINPEGVIVAKDLRGMELENKIISLVNQQ